MTTAPIDLAADTREALDADIDALHRGARLWTQDLGAPGAGAPILS